MIAVRTKITVDTNRPKVNLGACNKLGIISTRTDRHQSTKQEEVSADSFFLDPQARLR